MSKQRARIESWVFGAIGDDGLPTCLFGYVKDHPRQGEFSEDKVQRTSRLVSYDLTSGVAETRNTIYQLGKPGFDASSYPRQM